LGLKKKIAQIFSEKYRPGGLYIHAHASTRLPKRTLLHVFLLRLRFSAYFSAFVTALSDSHLAAPTSRTTLPVCIGVYFAVS